MPSRINEKNTYTVQILTSIQEIRQTCQEWQNFLKKNAGKHSIWQDPQRIIYHLEAGGDAEPRIILLRKKGVISCIAPCIIYKTRFNLNFSVFQLPAPRIRTLKIMDSDCIFSQQSDSITCLNTIFSTLKEMRSDFDLIVLENLPAFSPLRELFAEQPKLPSGFVLKITSHKPEKIHRHILEESHETWLNALRGKTRGKIRRKIRSLFKHYPDQVECIEITSPQDIPNFLNKLNEIYPKTWQAKTFGQVKRNKATDIDYYTKMAQQGWVRSYLLEIRHTPVAFLVGLQYNSILYHADCGYDPKFSKEGVGSVLNFLMLENIYKSNSPKILDFGFGENEYKRILGNDDYDACEAYILKPDLWGYIARLQLLLSFIEKNISLLLTRLHLDEFIRKLLKRKK